MQTIKDTSLDAAKDSRDQIERKHLILDAYHDFRGALKESEVMALDILKNVREWQALYQLKPVPFSISD